MNATSVPDTARRIGWLDRLLRKRLLAMLEHLEDGQVQLHEANQLTLLGNIGNKNALQPQLHIHDPRFYRQATRNGSVGVGEAYMDGHWQCDDLVALMRLLLRNRERLDAMETGIARLGGWALRALHTLARNTRSGSRRNITSHYDLGNALFQLFLDQNMMYSSAIFTEEETASAEAALERAAARKLERICAKLRLKPEHHVLEIGGGWGGFALHAARHHGCRVTTTTISHAQYALTTQRVAEAGLSAQVTVLMRDYRDLTGHYDRIVSIEMIEAIGHQYLDTYFAKAGSLLNRDGEALIQAITIEDHRYRQALRSVDFIKRYIFPGSFIPSVAAMSGALARASDLRLFNLEDIGPSYALTLRAWRQRFMARLPQVRALGYDERFIRMWEFYLAYCEAGFLERTIGDVQLWLCKPGARPPQFVPALLSPT